MEGWWLCSGPWQAGGPSDWNPPLPLRDNWGSNGKEYSFMRGNQIQEPGREEGGVFALAEAL